MVKTNEFAQPINPISGDYPTTWPGYSFLQTLGGGRKGVHVGVDYNGPGGGNADFGMDVCAVANGVIEKLIHWDGKSIGYGNHLFIRHELNDRLKAKYGVPVLYSHYAHNEAFRCFEGQEVSKGQVVAKLGHSGTELAHSHVEIRKPTGRGYEDYPSTQSLDWLNKYYYDTYKFINDNLKEPENNTTPTTPPTAESPVDTKADIPPQDTPEDIPTPPTDTNPDLGVPTADPGIFGIDSSGAIVNHASKDDTLVSGDQTIAPLQPLSVNGLSRWFGDVIQRIFTWFARW